MTLNSWGEWLTLNLLQTSKSPSKRIALSLILWSNTCKTDIHTNLNWIGAFQLPFFFGHGESNYATLICVAINSSSAPICASHRPKEGPSPQRCQSTCKPSSGLLWRLADCNRPVMDPLLPLKQICVASMAVAAALSILSVCLMRTGQQQC